MKTLLKFLLLSITLFLNSGCNKYEICSNIPEGLYEGWFTDEGANPLYLLMNVFVIDDNTLIINSSNNPLLCLRKNEREKNHSRNFF